MGISLILLTFLLLTTPTTTWEYIKYQTPFSHGISYEYTENTLSVSGELDNGSYELIMMPCGPNNIMAIKDMVLTHPNESLTLISGTDWVGPYVVLDPQESSDTPWYFTGGWHETIDTLEPTAKMIHYSITNSSGGNLDTAGKTDKIIIEVTNLINDYNTREAALKETVTYTITKSQIDVSTEIVAIKSCIIDRYFGLQMYHGPFKHQMTYTSDTSQYLYPMTESSYGPLRSEDIVHTMTMSSKHLAVIGWIDETNGLGDFSYLGEDQSSAFTMSYGKSYFNLINGVSCQLSEGETLSWSGGYQIKTIN